MNLVLHQRTTTATTCVVCRDALGVLAVCPGCGVTTHAGCAAERRGCPTAGCAQRDALPVARMTEQHVRDVRPAPAKRPSKATSRDRLAALATRRVPASTYVLVVALTVVVIAAVSWVVFRRLP